MFLFFKIFFPLPLFGFWKVCCELFSNPETILAPSVFVICHCHGPYVWECYDFFVHKYPLTFDPSMIFSKIQPLETPKTHFLQFK